MGYFGDIHLSNSLPSPELLPMENIQAVHQELGKAFEHNTATAESLEQQLNKTKLRDNKQWYAKKLAKETTEAINTVRDNPFEMPYANKMIRNLANEKYINNQELHKYIEDKQNEDNYYSELNNLLKNYSALDKGDEGSKTKGSSESQHKKVDGTYSKEVINTARLISKSLNQKEAIYDPETGSLENSFNGYNPVAKPDIEQKLINNISKLSGFYQKRSSGNLQATNDPMYLSTISIKELPPAQIIKLADVVLDDDPEYQDWLKQKALFERVANTERDENGLLKLDKSGNFLENHFIERVKENKDFRKALTMSFEVDENAGRKNSKGKTLPPKYVAKDTEIGMIGSDDKAFEAYFSDSKNREIYYNWYVENEKIKLKKDTAAAFAYKQVDVNFRENKTSFEIFKNGLNSVKQNVQHASNVRGNLIITPTSMHDSFASNLSYAQKSKNSEMEANVNRNWLTYISKTMLLDKGENKFLHDYGNVIIRDENLKKIFLKEILSNNEIVSRIPVARNVKNKAVNNNNNNNKDEILDNMVNAVLEENLGDGFVDWLTGGTQNQRFNNFITTIYNNNYKEDVLKAIRATLYNETGRDAFDNLATRYNKDSYSLVEQSNTSYVYQNKAGTPIAYYTTTENLANVATSNFLTINGKNHNSYMMKKIKEGKVFYIDEPETSIPANTASESIKYKIKDGISRHQINNKYYNQFEMMIGEKRIGFIGDNDEITSEISLANPNVEQSAKNIFITHYDYIKSIMDNVEMNGYEASVYSPIDLKNAIYSMASIAMRDFEVINSFKGYEDTFAPQTLKIYDPKEDKIAFSYDKIVIPQFNEFNQLEGVKVGNDSNNLKNMTIDDFYLKTFLECFGKENPLYIEMAKFARINIQ